MGNRIIQKPFRGTQLNKSHPLSKGLIGCWIMNEGSGGIIRDLSGNKYHAVTTRPWVNGGVKGDYSIDLLHAPSTAKTHVAIISDSTVIIADTVYLSDARNSGGTYFYFDYNNNINFGSVHFGFNYTDLVPSFNVIILTNTGNSLDLWLNGKKGITSTNSISTIVGPYFRLFGRHSDEGYLPRTCQTYMLYDRILTDYEVLSLNQNPYQMFEHTRTPFHIVPAPAKGLWVVDSVIPQSIDAGGFASDGAFHVDTNSDHEAEIHFDIERNNPSFVLHDPSIRTGDGSTEHLVGHWKCDDNAANTTILAEVGSNGVLVGGDNTEDLFNVDSVRGTSLLTNGTDDYINLLDGIGDLTTEDEFTVYFKAKPNFNYDVASIQGIFGVYFGTDYLLVSYAETNDSFYLKTTPADLNESIYSSAYTSNYQLQQWILFGIHINITEEFIAFSINGEILGVISGTMSWDDAASSFCIGKNPFSGYGAIYIDEIKLYDACILPYGTFISAQHVHDDDYTDAHNDITFYWDGSDCTSTDVQIGGVQGTLGSNNTGGSTSFVETGGPANTGYFDNESDVAVGYGIAFPITSNDIINPEFCSISFWAYIPIFESSNRILSVDNGSLDAIKIATQPTEKFVLTLTNTDGTQFSYAAAHNTTPVASWFFIRAEVDIANGGGRLFLNNFLVAEVTNFTGVLRSSTHVRICHNSASYGNNIDAYVYGFTITNDPYTPELPFVMGHGPVVTPRLYES